MERLCTVVSLVSSIREVVAVAVAETLAGAVQATAEVELVIGGMTCAACAARVRTPRSSCWCPAATITLTSVFVLWNSLRLRRAAIRPGRSGETR